MFEKSTLIWSNRRNVLAFSIIIQNHSLLQTKVFSSLILTTHRRMQTLVSGVKVIALGAPPVHPQQLSVNVSSFSLEKTSRYGNNLGNNYVFFKTNWQHEKHSFLSDRVAGVAASSYQLTCCRVHCGPTCWGVERSKQSTDSSSHDRALPVIVPVYRWRICPHGGSRAKGGRFFLRRSRISSIQPLVEIFSGPNNRPDVDVETCHRCGKKKR